MITLFNRKELIITNSIEHIAKIRYALEANGVDYKIGTSNIGNYMGNSHSLYNNYIYVRKKDYEQAEIIMASALSQNH
jgi:hypothetical protein